MKKKLIRVGIVGAGDNTRNRHIPLLQAMEGVEIVSVCNRSHASSERVASRFGIPQIYDDWRELVAAPDTNAIVIGTWPYLHCPATLAALAAEKHVMVEARMAMNVNEAEQMLAAAEAKPHLVTQIVPAPASFGVDAAMQRLIAEGYLGEILAIEVRDHTGTFLNPNAPLHWRQNEAWSGLNLLNLGIWYETLMRWVGQATLVVARGKTYVKMRPHPDTGQPTPTRVPEHFSVIADMACGAQALFSLSQVTGLRSVLEFVLYGREGTLLYDGKTLYGGQRGVEQLSEIEVPDEERGTWRVEEEFVGAIRGQESICYTDFATGLKYMQFTEGVAVSLREGKIVHLP